MNDRLTDEQVAGMNRYAAMMKEIKLRTELITSYLKGDTIANYHAIAIESVGLQFRKIFESIMFSSLAANRKEYVSTYRNFESHWEVSKLVKNLTKINPDFYPKPVIEESSTVPGVLHNLKDRSDDFLTKSKLVEAYGRCGELLHAPNPYGKELDYGFYERLFPIWLTSTINLLNNHVIRLAHSPNIFIVHMQETGKENEVSWYYFGRLSEHEDSR